VDLAATYAASRAPYTVNRGTGTADGRTVIVRKGAGLPSWMEQTDVFDGSGRLVLSRERGPVRLQLAPGTYFARVAGGTRDQGLGAKSEATYRLLVLN